MLRIFKASVLNGFLFVQGSSWNADDRADIPLGSWNSTLDHLKSIGGDAGAFMVNWVEQRLGQHISREGHSATSCWDLVMAAIEAANSNGFHVPTGHDGKIQGHAGWVWSDEPISWDQALPGDVAQFAYWYEYYNHHTHYTADMHSALIYAVEGNTVKVYEQNPSVAKKGEYHPAATKKSGVMQVFRVGGGSSPSPTPPPPTPRPPSPSPSPASCTDKSGWQTQEGDDCDTFAQYNYCTPDGQTGSGWKSRWGNIENYHDGAGDSCFDACCACGGGSSRTVIV